MFTLEIISIDIHFIPQFREGSVLTWGREEQGPLGEGDPGSGRQVSEGKLASEQAWHDSTSWIPAGRHWAPRQPRAFSNSICPAWEETKQFDVNLEVALLWHFSSAWWNPRAPAKSYAWVTDQSLTTLGQFFSLGQSHHSGLQARLQRP